MRNRILVCLYVVLLAFPAVAMLAGVPDRPVFGALAKKKRPHLRFWSIVTEKYQQRLKEWFESEIGMRGYAVYADNTVLARAFHETKPDATVMIGDDGVLFLFEDVNGFNRTPAYMPSREAVEHQAATMADVQTRMRAKRRLFLPVLIPSKTTVYRDKLPARWISPLSPRLADDLYPMVKQALDAHHVAYIDMFPFMASQERRNIWPPLARHWSRRAGCEALREALARYSAMIGIAPIEYDCTLGFEDRFPDHDDFDLWQLMNARVDVSDRRAVTVQHHEPVSSVRPNLLLLGTSFNWHMLRDAAESNVFGRLHMNYYNQTFVDWPSNGREHVEPHTATWRDITFPNDIYLVDMFETYMPLSPEMFEQLASEIEGMPSR